MKRLDQYSKPADTYKESYILVIYDGEELFSNTDDGATSICARNIREAAIAFHLILNAIREKEDHMETIQKRYLKA